MLLTWYIILVVAIFALGYAMVSLRRYLAEQKRKKLYATPLRPEWVQLLGETVPLSGALPKSLEHAYHGHINYFLATKEFVGRGGYEIDDRTRLTIAGNACLLVLKRKEPIFSSFKTIIVYPETYAVPTTRSGGDGIVVQHTENRAGESWYRGPVVLAWSDVNRGSDNPDDAHNVVVHEFAHKLDEENQLMDGLPILQDRSHYAEWSEVLSKEYGEFLSRVKTNSNRVIDSYGAVSAVEFFAVISESFFEKPQQMKQRLPELYAQLSRYYGVDTAEW